MTLSILWIDSLVTTSMLRYSRYVDDRWVISSEARRRRALVENDDRRLGSGGPCRFIGPVMVLAISSLLLSCESGALTSTLEAVGTQRLESRYDSVEQGGEGSNRSISIFDEAMGAGWMERKDGRLENAKVFLDEDEGLFRGFFFTGPIHYRGPEGEWLDIDTNVRRLDADNYGVDRAPYGVRFPVDPKGDLAAAHIVLPGGGMLDYRVLSIGTEEKVWTRADEKMNVFAAGNRLSYEMPSLGIELRYTAFPTRLKEDVVILADSPVRDYCREGSLVLEFSISSNESISPVGTAHRGEVFSLDRELRARLSSGEVFFIEPVYGEARAGDGSEQALSLGGEAQFEEERLFLKVSLPCSELWEAPASKVLIDPTVGFLDPRETTFIAKAFPDENYCDGLIGVGGVRYPQLLAGLHSRAWPARSFGQTIALLMFDQLQNVCVDDIVYGRLSIDRDRQTEGFSVSVGRSRCTWLATGCSGVTWSGSAGICREGDDARVFDGTRGWTYISANTGRVSLNATSAVRSIVAAGGTRVLAVEGPKSGTGNRAVSFFSDLAEWEHWPYIEVAWTTECTPNVTENRDCGNCGTQSRTCSPDGCAWGSWSVCRGQGCTPGDTRCNGNGVERCNDSCQWVLDEHCPCGCSEGSCVSPECNPNETRCDGDAVERCDSNGCNWFHDETCSCGCHEGRCVSQICAPGEPRCDGNDVERCDADGCNWVHEESCPCGCEGGGCVSPVCTPGDTRCAGDDLQLCDDDGCRWDHHERCECGCREDACISPCTCEGEASRECRDCGLEQRECGAGQWTDWGPCEPLRSCPSPEICDVDAWCVPPPSSCPPDVEPECEPDAVRSCDEGGTQTCTEDCTWGPCEGGEVPVVSDGGCCSVASSTSSASAWMLTLVVLFASLRRWHHGWAHGFVTPRSTAGR